MASFALKNAHFSYLFHSTSNLKMSLLVIADICTLRFTTQS